MATKVKPTRLQITGVPQVGKVPTYVDKNTFAWGNGGGGGGYGRFLSLWDCSTGMPISFPEATPYTYLTGDYFLVETVSTATPPVNYRPDGATYTGTASTVVETDEIEVGDVYIYDGSVWLLQSNHGKTVAFANIAGQPTDNLNLASALSGKLDTSALSDNNYGGAWNGDTTHAATKNAIYTKIHTMDVEIGNKAADNTVVKLSGNQTIAGTKTFSTSPVVPSKTTDATNTGTAIATEAQVYKKQDTLVSGTNIKTINSNSLLGSGDIALNDVKVSAAAPSSPAEGMVWYDTTNDQLKVYDGTNWNVTGKEYNAGKGIEIEDGPDYSAMQGPAPTGYHVPSKDEWDALRGILITTFSMAANATTVGTYLKMPMTGRRAYNNASVYGVGSYGYCWTSTPFITNNARCFYFDSSDIAYQNYDFRTQGYSVRCFKDIPTIPTSSWTTLYDGSSIATGAGIFYNATDGLISVSGDGQTRYTIQDKNLGATTVFNQGDTVSDANSGYFYQWGNNYGFSHSGNVTTSSTQVDASNYGPGNYYSSSTFIKGSKDWSSVQNDNLWGGVTGAISNIIINTGVLSVNGQTGDVTISTPEESNTKTFYLSSTSDLTTAQAAYDWYDDGKNPIIVLNDKSYILSSSSASELAFCSSEDAKIVDGFLGYTIISSGRLGLTLNSGTVISVNTSSVQSRVVETDINYTTPYTPQYNGSPATKKYVDDNKGIQNDTTGTTTTVTKIRAGTEAEYALITPDANTIYHIY